MRPCSWHATTYLPGSRHSGFWAYCCRAQGIPRPDLDTSAALHRWLYLGWNLSKSTCQHTCRCLVCGLLGLVPGGSQYVRGVGALWTPAGSSLPTISHLRSSFRGRSYSGDIWQVCPRTWWRISSLPCRSPRHSSRHSCSIRSYRQSGRCRAGGPNNFYLAP